MPVKSIRELFVYGLEDAYAAERQLGDALDDLGRRATDEELAGAFRDHREETEEHVGRLEAVFEAVGAAPTGRDDRVIGGLLAEYEEFVGMEPDGPVLDAYALEVARAVERYEVGAYESLVGHAERLEEETAADLLGRTLDEERAALDRLGELAETFDYGAIPANP